MFAPSRRPERRRDIIEGGRPRRDRDRRRRRHRARRVVDDDVERAVDERVGQPGRGERHGGAAGRIDRGQRPEFGQARALRVYAVHLRRDRLREGIEIAHRLLHRSRRPIAEVHEGAQRAARGRHRGGGRAGGEVHGVRHDVVRDHERRHRQAIHEQHPAPGHRELDAAVGAIRRGDADEVVELRDQPVAPIQDVVGSRSPLRGDDLTVRVRNLRHQRVGGRDLRLDVRGDVALELIDARAHVVQRRGQPLRLIDHGDARHLVRRGHRQRLQALEELVERRAEPGVGRIVEHGFEPLQHAVLRAIAPERLLLVQQREVEEAIAGARDRLHVDAEARRRRGQLGALAAVARRVHVGQVVADGVERGLMRGERAPRDVEAAQDARRRDHGSRAS